MTNKIKNNENIENELKKLREEVQHFKQEKERVKAILGSIGGVPSFNDKVLNFIFAISIMILLGISWMAHDVFTKLEMVELTITALSVKIIFLIHNQTKVDHFKLWILSTMEWRVNEILTETKKLSKEIKNK